MTLDETRDALRATLARLGMAETAFDSDVGATMSRAPRIDHGVEGTLPPLTLLASAAADDPAADLEARAVLGRGGMGVVHLAEQRSLRREVAVKVALRPDDAVRRALVREARTMGGLEHPNVVPVHALGRDANGGPILVMKRVEGVSWRALLDDPDHAGWAPLVAGHGERMRANVEILGQVARALAFAHSRGVLHRDLKPDNVMIGAFGEVYLLDWGLAIRLDERAEQPDEIVGTPGYLAPEMAHGEAKLLDERTDVYLLGATLFELLTGTMPHAAATPIAALTRALLGELPAIPESAPADLAELARASLALDPGTRPPSAEAFRTALTRHLASREADVLVAAADAGMARADVGQAREGGAAISVFRALVEARFALSSALAIRPGHEPTAARLDACVLRLVDREIALRSPLAARDLLADVRLRPASALTRIDALERELVEERNAAASARRSEAEADISSAWRVIGGVTFVGALFGIPFAVLSPPLRLPTEVLGANAFIAGVLLVVVILARRRLLSTPGSRRLTAFMVTWALYPLPIALVGLAAGQAHYDMATAVVTGGLLAAIGAITLLPRLWPAVLLHAAASVAALRWPDQQPIILSLLINLNMLVIVDALRCRAAAMAPEPAR